METETQKVSDLARLVTSRLDDIAFRKSQVEVAADVGFKNSNMVTLIKLGKSKLALDRVEAMAKALGLETEVVLIPALKQYFSDDVISMLREVFSGAQTQTERDLLVIARKSMDTKETLSFETRQAIAETLKNNKPAGA